MQCRSSLLFRIAPLFMWSDPAWDASSWLAGLFLDQRRSWSKELHAAIDLNWVPVDQGKKQKTLLGLEHGVRCRVKICWAIERRMFEHLVCRTWSSSGPPWWSLSRVWQLCNGRVNKTRLLYYSALYPMIWTKIQESQKLAWRGTIMNLCLAPFGASSVP